MTPKPRCVIVTGQAGSGKTTLAKKLAERLWLPGISRDEIKQGYVETHGVTHDRLPPGSDKIVTDLFFEMIHRYLEGKISIVIEAAFQHHVWEPRMPTLIELGSPFIVLCEIDPILAARRHLDRGLENPERERYHSDNRVTHFRKTGEFLYPAKYDAPRLDLPTIKVATEADYNPSVEEIVAAIKAS